MDIKVAGFVHFDLIRRHFIDADLFHELHIYIE